MFTKNEKKDPTPLRCKRCSHTWQYSGTNPYVATCPHCRTQLTKRKQRRFQKIIFEITMHMVLGGQIGQIGQLVTTLLLRILLAYVLLIQWQGVLHVFIAANTIQAIKNELFISTIHIQGSCIIQRRKTLRIG